MKKIEWDIATNWDKIFLYVIFFPGMCYVFGYAIYSLWNLHCGACCG